MIKPAALALGAVLAAAGSTPLRAQDVEMLGRIYGTRPPDAYFERRAADPDAFEMTHGLAAPRRALGPAALREAGGVAALTLGRRVAGTFRFPVLLGLFSDSPGPPYGRTVVQKQFFDGPNQTGTIPDLYWEMSGGQVRVSGDVLEWARSTFSRARVTNGVSALSSSSRLGSFILELLSQTEGVDWGAYDNDGADGIPNSGDDDGYVDVLAIMHPTQGAECGGVDSTNRVWSHKWALLPRGASSGGAAGQDFVTTTPSMKPSFGRIRVSDYTIQPVYACSGTEINQIGVFAHELGHGFGLPDLYTRSGEAGAGRWDLMGTGAWGCSSTFEPERPCHMGAWSKAALGWVDVQVAPFGTDLGRFTLEPVESGKRVLVIPSGDGSGEYYLLENRQRIGFDGNLAATGLLVWQIDARWIDRTIATNAVNDNVNHLGVWLRQADGLNQLARTSSASGNRGDSGDPFPGTTGNVVFHASSTPASFTNGSVATGVTLTEIAEEGQRVSFRALSRYQTVRVRGTGESGAGALFTIDGAPIAGALAVVSSAPFQRHAIEAVAGAPLGEGLRRGFAGWQDAPGSSRVRAWTTGLADAELVAVYGGPREVRLAAAVEGGRFNVTPGKLVTTPASPDLWFAEGTEVAFQAQATTGFEFRGWKGALAGRPNPTVLRMDAPKDATAIFELVFGLEPATVSLPAATVREVVLEAKNANLPTAWTLTSGVLPDGMSFSKAGKLTGEAIVTGAFPLAVSVTDALGLQASGAVTLQVTVPVIGTAALAARILDGEGALTYSQQRYLDRAGNNNGDYDLGDFRAYVLANPSAPPVAAQEIGGARVVVPVVDLAPGGTR